MWDFCGFFADRMRKIGKERNTRKIDMNIAMIQVKIRINIEVRPRFTIRFEKNGYFPKSLVFKESSKEFDNFLPH